MADIPAVLGGTPLFPSSLPLVRPMLPAFAEVSAEVAELFTTGMVTTGHFLDELEVRVAAYLDVPYVVAVSSCTLGLVLTLQALGLEGEVIVPSYTFMATVHAIRWNHLTPVFVDVDPSLWTIDPARVETAITPNTSAILAVHTHGAPAQVEALEAVAHRHGLALVFDAAHGFGALHQGKPLGCYGNAEVFSASPTKLLIAGEGGIVATCDEQLARRMRLARNYGNDGTYNSRFYGLNARMPEFNAILGLKSLEMLEASAAHRNSLATLYRRRFSTLPGVTMQCVLYDDRSSYKDFALLVHEDAFGLSRNRLAQALKAEGIDSRFYYDPPVHTHKAYLDLGLQNKGCLPVTEDIAPRTITIPIHSQMDEATANRVCDAFERIYQHATEIRAAQSEAAGIY